MMLCLELMYGLGVMRYTYWRFAYARNESMGKSTIEHIIPLSRS